MRKAIAAVLLAGHLLLLLYLTLIVHTTPSLPPGNRLNLTVSRTITIFHHKGGREMIVNNVGNLGALFPAGFLLPLVLGPRIGARQVGLACGGVSLLIESLQYLSGRRVADVDDVLLNTLGGLLGFAAYRALSRILPRASASAPSAVPDPPAA